MEKPGLNGNSGSAALLFLTGLGAGIALAVLLTPRSGAATRRLIGRKAGEGEVWVKEKAADAQDYVRCYAEDLGGRIKEVADVLGRGCECGTRQDAETTEATVAARS